MASAGRANPKYKALLGNSDTLGDVLDANDAAKTKLLRKLKANQWIEPKADLSTDALVNLVLHKIESEGGQVFDQFIEFLSPIVGLENLAQKMKGIPVPFITAALYSKPSTYCSIY